GHASRPLTDLARRPRDRGAGVGGDATAAGAHAEREERGVTGNDLDVVERRAQLLGGDLGQRGAVALALRGHAEEADPLAAWIDSHRRAVERPEAGALGIAAEPDTQSLDALPALLLTPAPLVVAEDRQRAIEGGREIAGVVGDRHAVLVSQART